MTQGWFVVQDPSKQTTRCTSCRFCSPRTEPCDVGAAPPFPWSALLPPADVLQASPASCALTRCSTGSSCPQVVLSLSVPGASYCTRCRQTTPRCNWTHHQLLYSVLCGIHAHLHGKRFCPCDLRLRVQAQGFCFCRAPFSRARPAIFASFRHAPGAGRGCCQSPCLPPRY